MEQTLEKNVRQNTEPVKEMSDAKLPDLSGRVVFIGTPAYEGKVGVAYCNALVDTAVALVQCGAQVIKGQVTDSGSIPRSRNMMVARALAADATDLLFIDSDMGWRPMDAIRLLMWDTPDIVAAAYPARSDKNSRWIVVTDEKTEMDLSSGLISVRRAGTGFMRIPTALLRELIEQHPELHYEAFHTVAMTAEQYDARVKELEGQGATPEAAVEAATLEKERSKLEADNLYALFNYRHGTEPDGHVGLLSEDYYFCDVARAAGFRILIDPNIWMSHEGRKVWEGKFSDAITIVKTDEEQVEA